MQVFQPQIKVLLVKATRRKEIADNMPVIQERYSRLDNIDLTPFLGDRSSVRVTKSTRQPSGGFSINFADQPQKDFLETVYALIEPMDMIEIRMCHSPTAIKNGKIPLIMRGFVSSVSRPETMEGNNPVRSVVVTGHDFSKVMQIFRISYMLGTEGNDSVMSALKFFREYADDGVKKNMSGNAFAQLAIDKLINPYMANIAQLTKADQFGAHIINQWTLRGSIEGDVSALAVSSFTDESLYNMMRTILDVGAFNELYLEDTEEAPVLVLRPVPFKSVDGEFIQGSAESLDIPSIDITSYTPTRSDEGVANYFWVSNNRMAMMTNINQMASAMHGSASDFQLFDHFNCSKSIYGLRKLEVETTLGEPVQTDSNANKRPNVDKEGEALMTWQDKRRKLLADMNKDNVVFEQGGLSLRGNENIKAGMYLRLLRGVNQTFVGEVYAHTISHDFAPFRSYSTAVQFDRGTGFIARSQTPNTPYIAEIEAQGAW
jgi:hypothetical protein